MPRGRPRKRAAAQAPRTKRQRKNTPPAWQGDTDTNADVDTDFLVCVNENVEDGIGDSKDGSDSQPWESPVRKTGDARETLKALQNLIESTEKEEELAKAFEKTVKDEEQRLLGIVEEKAEEEEFEAQFAELLTAALAPTGTGTSETAPFVLGNPDDERLRLDITADKHPLYIASKALLDSTQAMLKDCKKYLKQTKKLQVPDTPNAAWEQEQREAMRIISAAKVATAAEIEQLLNDEREKRKKKDVKKNKQKQKQEKYLGSHDSTKDQKLSHLPSSIEGEGGKGESIIENDVRLQQVLTMGRQAVEKEHGKREVYGWGKVACQVEKAMKGLVKALPDEKD
ncbi:hypothetical protein MAP00_000257 [Monascus purpureus]|nr:hypothetical protein MAP00_000257 [Monascus purpureus]